MTPQRRLSWVAVTALTLMLVVTIIPHSSPVSASGNALVGSPVESRAAPNTATPAPALGGSAAPPLSPSPATGATPTWTDLSATAGAPPPRISGGLIYDGEDGYTILFGGEYLNTTTFAYTYYNDTWEFSGGTWTNITTPYSPSPRYGFGIAFDPEAGEVVLFGGRNAAGVVLNDTWQFSGGSWSNLTSSPAPSPRFWPSMVYDSSTYSVVLFGGVSPTSTDLNDTWTFQSGTWTQATPTTHPESRHGATFMDDPPGSDAILFGGLGAQYYNTTWSWSGTDWTDLSSSLLSSTNPDARVGAGGAFDTALNEEVMYGGYPANYYPYGTWSYVDLNWTVNNNLPDSPTSATVWNQLTYDAADSWIVYLVPNSNQTFVFNETTGGGTGGLQVSPSASPLSGVVPLTVVLSATIIGGAPPYNVTWALGTGTSLFTANTSATYATPGTYNLTLTVHDSGSGHYFGNWTVRASAPPLQADASAVPSVATIGQSVSFNSTYSGGWPPYTFNWSFGDGSYAATQNATHAYGSAATFNVSFEVVAATGGSVFVNFTEEVAATISPLTLVATGSPTSGVAPVTVVATSTPAGGEPPYTYRWSWGDGSATSATENATHTYGGAGSYVVLLNVSDFEGSSVEQSWSVTVTAPLSVTIAASPLSASVGAAVAFTSTPAGGTSPYSYAWSFGDGQSATTRNATHAFGSTGVFVVNLTVTDSSGHSAHASVSVTVSASSTGPATSNPGGLSVTDWLALVLIILVIAMLLIFVAWRRRKKQPPPAMAGAPGPAPPKTP